jgi:tetratricopeptide (TPR) repeat protein
MAATGGGDWSLIRDAAEMAMLQGRYDDAERRFVEALDGARAAGAPEEEMAPLLRHLCDVQTGQGKLEQATETAAEWVAMVERVHGPDDRAVGEALGVLGAAVAAQSDTRRAKSLFRRSRQILEEALGRWHPEVADCLMAQADMLVEDERYADALPLYRRALAIFESEVGPDTEPVAEALAAAADCLAATEDDQAKRYFRRALATWQHVAGADSVEAAEAAQRLAEFYIDEEEFEAAAPLLGRALAAFEERSGPNSLDVAYCLQNLSLLSSELNQAEAAFLHFRRALAIYDADESRDDRDRPTLLERFAVLADTAGRPDEAEAARRRAETLRRRSGA